jgi:hypothetical protein
MHALLPGKLPKRCTRSAQQVSSDTNREPTTPPFEPNLRSLGRPTQSCRTGRACLPSHVAKNTTPPTTLHPPAPTNHHIPARASACASSPLTPHKLLHALLTELTRWGP